MAHAFIGAGQCGCGIVDAMFSHKNMFKIAIPIVINSATQDLMNLGNLSKKYWIGISKTHGFVDGTIKGFDELVVGGFGKDPVKGGEILKAHYPNLKKTLKERIGGVGKDKRTAPVVFLAVGLGGGTGSGTAPFIARAIKELFDIPIIVIAVLPAVKEGSITAWNAWRCLNELFDYVDAYILVDNERITQLESMESMFKQYNMYVAQSLIDLLLGTVLEKIRPSDYALNPPVIDIQDIITALTFKSGLKSKPGFATLARVSDRIRPFSRYLLPFGGYQKVNVESLIERSFGRLTLKDAKPEDCMKSLALLRVPSYYLKRKGRINTNAVFQTLKEQTKSQETHFGISITKKNLASITLLVTYMPSLLTRLKDLEERAGEHEKVSTKLFDAYGGGLKAEGSTTPETMVIDKKMHDYGEEFIPKKEEAKAEPEKIEELLKKIISEPEKVSEHEKKIEDTLTIDKTLLNELPVWVLSDIAEKAGIYLKTGIRKEYAVDTISKSDKLTPSLVLKVLENQEETPGTRKVKDILMNLGKKAAVSKVKKEAEETKEEPEEVVEEKPTIDKKILDDLTVSILTEIAGKVKVNLEAGMSKSEVVDAVSKSDKLTPSIVLKVLNKQKETPKVEKAKEELIKLKAEQKNKKPAKTAEEKTEGKIGEKLEKKSGEKSLKKNSEPEEKILKKRSEIEEKITKKSPETTGKTPEEKITKKPAEPKLEKPSEPEPGKFVGSKSEEWDKNKVLILEQIASSPLIDIAKASGIDAEKTWSKYKIIHEMKKSGAVTPELVLDVLSKRIETPNIKKIKEEVSKYI